MRKRGILVSVPLESLIHLHHLSLRNEGSLSLLVLLEDVEKYLPGLPVFFEIAPQLVFHAIHLCHQLAYVLLIFFDFEMVGGPQRFVVLFQLGYLPFVGQGYPHKSLLLYIEFDLFLL